jgi:outer membrane protein assembly factor BamB
VDAEDNIWVTDVMLNKVFKLSSDGRLIRAFGHDYPAYLETCFRIRSILPRFPATRNPLIFARPTDVVVVKNGDFIVTDGYRNKRLARFNKDGNLIWQVNHAGSGDGEFNLPHGLAMDAKGRLYVADRNNARIQVKQRSISLRLSTGGPRSGRSKRGAR